MISIIAKMKKYIWMFPEIKPSIIVANIEMMRAPNLINKKIQEQKDLKKILLVDTVDNWSSEITIMKKFIPDIEIKEFTTFEPNSLVLFPYLLPDDRAYFRRITGLIISGSGEITEAKLVELQIDQKAVEYKASVHNLDR